MFLLKMEAADYVGGTFYDFKPYNYGPFCSTIYQDVDYLVLLGLVREQQSGSYKVYVTTPAGRDKADNNIRKLTKKPKEYLSDLVDWVSSVDFGQLLRSIYAKYPKFAKKSLFRR